MLSSETPITFHGSFFICETYLLVCLLQFPLHIVCACAFFTYIPACIERHNLDSGTVTISPPNLHGNVSHYQQDIICKYVVTSQAHTRLLVEIDHVDLGGPVIGPVCDFDLVRLYFSANQWTVCDSGQRSVETEGNILGVYFRSLPGEGIKRGGFLIHVSVISEYRHTRT